MSKVTYGNGVEARAENGLVFKMGREHDDDIRAVRFDDLRVAVLRLDDSVLPTARSDVDNKMSHLFRWFVNNETTTDKTSVINAYKSGLRAVIEMAGFDINEFGLSLDSGKKSDSGKVMSEAEQRAMAARKRIAAKRALQDAQVASGSMTDIARQIEGDNEDDNDEGDNE